MVAAGPPKRSPPDDKGVSAASGVSGANGCSAGAEELGAGCFETGCLAGAGVGCCGVAGTAAGLAAGVAGLGGLVRGIKTTSLQCGHFPFLPAAVRGVRTTCPQKVQKNSIGPVSAVGLVATARAAGCCAAGVCIAGICITAWQLGHFPFLPAAASGVRTSWLHCGQGNSIVICRAPARQRLREKTEGRNFVWRTSHELLS